MIDWIGHSNWHKPKPTDGELRYRFPLTEEAVLEVATSNSELKHLSLEAAVTCCYRFAFRRALDDTGLNPKWDYYRWTPGAVVKAPASTASDGVHVVNKTWSVARLEPHVKDDLQGVVEEYIPGPQWEVNGVVLNGEVLFLRTFQQVWQDGTVLGYRSEWLQAWQRDAASMCLLAVGLDNCPFCIEMRRFEERAVVIECNARLGEDPHHPLDIKHLETLVKDHEYSRDCTVGPQEV
jgi:hypothetical protein